MKEQLISFKTAKLAKEKGFFIHTKYYYNSDNPLSDNINVVSRGWTTESSEGIVYKNIDEESGLLTYQIDSINNAPTQSLLQKWLREEHNIYIFITLFGDTHKKCLYQISILKSPMSGIVEDNQFYDNYEEALEKGLYETLNLIQDEKQSN